MAEVRKYAPGKGGHIAEAIAKAMGETVRPVTPGGSPDPSKSSRAKPAAYIAPAATFIISDAFLLPVADDDATPEGDERSDP